jgi:iron complex outermembrane recepter protein
MKRTLLVFLLILGWALGYAQDRKTITGTVSDNKGEALPGVSIVEKGTKNGVQSQANGTFRITVAANATLRFTFIGFTTKEIPVGTSTTLNVTLEDDSKVLNEVVVTGFGERTEKRKLSYSVTEVNGDDLARANNANMVNSLQGKVAGVMINQGASGPQSSSRIRIRGNASLGSNTQPLVVLDGVLIEPGTTGADSWGDNADFGNTMKNLNPDDYESITVLKGAAASALYGSKAQNGVLLINTKKGRTQKGLGVSIAQTSSFDDPYKLVDFQNEYGGGISPVFEKDANGVDMVSSIANINQGGYSFGPRFDGRMVKDLDGKMRPWVANDPLQFFQTGKFINTNVAVEGANENTSFRLSYTNLDNSSILPGNELKRNTFAIRATQKVSKTISLDASVNYSLTNSLNPGRQGSRNNPLFAFTYYMPRHADITYYTQNYINPVTGGALSSSQADLYDPYRLGSWAYDFFEDNRTQKENNLLANLDVNIKLTPWLSGLVKANTNSFGSSYERKYLGRGVNFQGGNYQINQQSNRAYRVQGLLNGSRKINEDIEATFALGGETYQSNINGSGYFNESYTDGGLKIPGVFSISNSLNPAITRAFPNPGRRTDAVYLYGDFTWKDMVTLNYSGRNDWSSSLTYKDGSGDHSYFYPSVGLSFIASELPAIKNSSVISFAKLRGALAYTGLDAEPQYTNRAGYYNLNGSFNNASGGNQSVYGFSDQILRNMNLKNQLTRELEVGADLRFFNNRLGFDVSWYKRNSTNQILSFALPAESGVSSQSLNAGDIQNKGIEILMTATPVKTKSFDWTSTINFTRNRNKIIALAPGVDSYELDLAFGNDIASVAKVGGEYGTLVTRYAFSNYQKKDASGNPVSHPNNGKRVLGNTGYGTTGGYYTFVRSGDYNNEAKELGSMMEKFLASATQQLSYKNVNVSFQVDAKVGGLMASATHQYGSANGNLANSLFGRDAASGGVTYTDDAGVTHHDGIIPDGVLNDGLTAVNAAGQTVDLGGMTYAQAVEQGLLKPIPAYAYYENLSQWSSGIREYSTFENSWVAVREVSVGYTLPSRLIQNLKLNSLRVNLTGRNLGYLYKTAKDGINPEGIFSNRAGAFAEYGGWPYVRSIGFNIQAGF